jgi:RimJ/RimL family protein N-acetyltransferase
MEATGASPGSVLEGFPDAPVLQGSVVLEPLRVEHAAEMAALLDDPVLHEFIGGAPATEAELTERFGRQTVGWSQDRSERWLNWVVRPGADDPVVGTVQATVTVEDERLAAEVAWVVATGHQGRGYAKAATSVMVAWLRAQGVAVVVAHVHPRHRASQGVASSVGLANTGTLVDGEERWEGVRPG